MHRSRIGSRRGAALPIGYVVDLLDMTALPGSDASGAPAGGAGKYRHSRSRARLAVRPCDAEGIVKQPFYFVTRVGLAMLGAIPLSVAAYALAGAAEAAGPLAFPKRDYGGNAARAESERRLKALRDRQLIEGPMLQRQFLRNLTDDAMRRSFQHQQDIIRSMRY